MYVEITRRINLSSMQGFGSEWYITELTIVGRYRPPGEDNGCFSFNGKRHPLGKRARKIDEGILIVRCTCSIPSAYCS